MARRDKTREKKSSSGAESDSGARARRGGGRDAQDSESAFPTIPKWLPAALFTGLTLLLFRAFIFSDQMLLGNDTLGLGYVVRAFYADALTRLGTFPLWAPDILGGTPFLEALTAGDSLYPPSALLLMVLEPYRALGWKLVLHVAAAGFFMFGWMRSIGGSRAAALVAGVGYMLAPFFVTLVHPGHDGKMFVIALTPLLFWAVERHFLRPRMRSFAAIALAVGIVIYTTHFQMAYFLFGAVGFFAFFRAIQVGRGAGVDDGAVGEGGRGAHGEDAGREPRAGGDFGGDGSEGTGDRKSDADGGPSYDDHAGLQGAGGARPAGAATRRAAFTFALFLAASVAGLGVAAVQFLPAFSYVTQDSRRVQTTRDAAGESSKAWSASWSLHPEEAVSLLVPEFVGGNVRGSGGWTEGTYWGRNPFKHNHEYIGLVLLLLAAVSFIGGARSGLRWFFTGLGTLALLFALGANTPIWHIAYALVPGVDLFRAVSQVVFLTGFSVATLAGLGLDRVLSGVASDDEERWRPVQRVLWGCTAAMGLFLALSASGVLTSVWTATVYSGIEPGRMQALEVLRPYLTQGAGIGFFIALAVSGLVWLVRGHYLAPVGLVAGVLLLVTLDEMRVDMPFIRTIDFEAWSAPDAHMRTILEREPAGAEPYRLLSFVNAGQDITPALHGIELAGGHHPNDLNRYRQLIGMVGSGLPVNLANGNIRRLLNVKYVLWPDYQMGASPGLGEPISRLQFASGETATTLYADAGLARARLVGSAVIKNDEQAVPYMLTPAFDPEREVVLAEAPEVDLPGGSVTGSVRWLERTPNRLRLEVTTDTPALLVIADNYYPAWKATVDGAEAPVLRAYHTLRAVPLGSGEQTVELFYDSDVIRRGLWISILTLLLVVGGAGFDLWRGRGQEDEP